MACILINGEVQSTFTIKDLEKAISDICSKGNNIDSIFPPIGYKTVILEKNVSFICSSQIQEDIDKKKLLIVFIVINLLVNV